MDIILESYTSLSLRNGPSKVGYLQIFEIRNTKIEISDTIVGRGLLKVTQVDIMCD